MTLLLLFLGYAIVLSVALARPGHRWHTEPSSGGLRRYTFFVIPVILPFYFWDKTRQERMIAQSVVENG
jgi:hypothetical protein